MAIQAPRKQHLWIWFLWLAGFYSVWSRPGRQIGLSEASQALRRVVQNENGELTIRYDRRVLWHRAHAKDEARISQGEIVENKRLGAALRWIAERQREREETHTNPR